MKAEQGNKTALAILRSKKEVVQPDKFADNQIQGTCTDNKGTVIITLPSGGTVGDTGKEINYSAHDKAADEVALQYAQEKWGKNRLEVEGNQIKHLGRKEKEQSWSR